MRLLTRTCFFCRLPANLVEDGAAALADFDVLVMANVRAPRPDVAAAIRARVEQGMGLWIAVGDRVEAKEYNAAFDALVIPESGQYGDHSDGGLELYYVGTGELSGILIDEETLGGDIVDAVLVSETKGYAIVGAVIGTAGETLVVSFDPTAGTRTGELIVADSWDHMTLELTPDGSELWVPDRKLDAPGIRIFDVATDAELTAVPIDVGLPPFMICFVGGAA